MTMTDVMPSVEVTAPNAVPYPFGLFSVAPATTPAEGHWGAGIWWRSSACNLAGVTYAPCSVEDPVPAKGPNVECGIVGGPAFTVYARSDESMGGAPVAQKFAAARDLLLAGEQYAVEQTLWGLLLAATPAADGTAGSVDEAIAMAEGLISDNYGGSPVLHMSRYTATMAYLVLHPEGERLVSVLRSQVVAGGGYGPSPVTSGPALSIIASGGLVVVRGTVEDLGEYYDTATNQISAVVERTYAIGWDCTAVRVAVPATP